MAEASHLTKFSPEEHPGGTLEAFQEFVHEYKYLYDATEKPGWERDSTDAQKKLWTQLNMRKVFLGKYSSRALQREYEEETTEAERDTMTFDEMVRKFEVRFRASSNTTLANYKFHKISQENNESFDTFILRVKHEASNCNFS